MATSGTQRRKKYLRRESFSRLGDGYATDQKAREARDVQARALRNDGHPVRRFTLRNQIFTFEVLDLPDERCPVYVIEVYPVEDGFRRGDAYLRNESFSRLWEGYATDQEAREARDARARELKKEGYRVLRHTLRNQLRPYAGFGRPDGRSCHVYGINVYRGLE